MDAEPHPGPAPRLSRRREQAVLSCLAGSPLAFGYKTDLWTTRRLAEVIEKRYGLRFNSNYLAEWLTRRGYRPQKPVVRADRPPGRAATDWTMARLVMGANPTNSHVGMIEPPRWLLPQPVAGQPSRHVP